MADGEFYSKKVFYIIFIFLSTAILAFGYVGATPAVKDVLNFYLLWLFFPAAIVFVIDLFTFKKFEQIDTVTIEDPEDSDLEEVTGFSIPVKWQLAIGVVFSVLIGWMIINQGFGIVGVPIFGIFDSHIGNAILSGIIGFYENFFFFGVIFPTLRATADWFTDNRLMAILIASLLVTIMFFGYHTWRYGFNQVALVYVIFFALLNVVFVSIFNSLIISDMVHATNNLLVGLGVVFNIAVSIVIV